MPRDNEKLGISSRTFVSEEDKSWVLDEARLRIVNDPYVRMNLKLQQQFGLRREEAMKFQPAYADRGDRIVLKASWTKGGKQREVPVRNHEQRKVLDEARRLATKGSLIPPHRRYVDQMRIYERETLRAGLHRMHGLRHAYAQQRYEELTGWKPPVQGGPKPSELNLEEKEIDTLARKTISRELGHERVEITKVYL